MCVQHLLKCMKSVDEVLISLFFQWLIHSSLIYFSKQNHLIGLRAILCFFKQCYWKSSKISCCFSNNKPKIYTNALLYLNIRIVTNYLLSSKANNTYIVSIVNILSAIVLKVKSFRSLNKILKVKHYFY